MGATSFITVSAHAVNFTVMASREGWDAVVTDVKARQEKTAKKPKRATVNRCVAGTCAVCFLEDRMARLSSRFSRRYQLL
ncbi:hypothetical protein LQW54_000318 [Pestalotiopsis sp. IQ-011]